MVSMLNKLIKILAIASISIMVLPVISSAQTVNVSYALSNELNVEFSPTYPRPNSNVSINLTLYTADLNSADITWQKDGKTVLKGKGETKYAFRAGTVGIKTEIVINITLIDGTSFSKTLSINPASVDMVWEAQSYVPPFYEGKALHPRQGVLKIAAMPEFVSNGQRTSPANLIYKWSNNVEVYQDQSGYGKNVVVLDGSLLGKSENIKVSVTDPVNNLTAENYITINPVNPEIVFYQNDPYYGNIFDSAVSGYFNLSGSEVQILAAPYYFTKENSVKYEWRLNGQTIQNLTGSMTAIFKKPEGGNGQSAISLQVTNPGRILQEADNNLTIEFKK
jgi:hypothetical protein